MTHEQLIAIGARWLRRSQNCGLVFAEMSTYATENPDLIGWCRRTKRTTLIEVKVSRNDFRRDPKKRAHQLERLMGSRRYYLTPEHLVMPNDLPADHGLLYVEDGAIRVSKPAPDRDLDAAAIADETTMLLSAIRRLQLGSQFDHESGRWESMVARKKRQGLR